MDCDQILPNIFVGAYPANDRDIDALKTAGVTAVLNVQSHSDFRDYGIDWPSIQAHYDAQGIKVCRLPIQDFDDDELLEKLPAAVERLRELLQDGHTAYVHCTAGINRSPSVVASYMHWYDGWELDDALEHLLVHRYCAPLRQVIEQASRSRQQ